MTDNAEERLNRIAALLERLSALELSSEARKLVTDLHALCGEAGTNTMAGQPPEIDPTVLDHVLGLVGPQDAQTLLDRLHLDLTQCRDALREGVAAWDWAGLRMAAHNLVSLSGTAGAEPLRREAITLVATCDRQDRARVETEVAQIIPHLEGLLGHLDQKSSHLAGDRR